MSSSDIASVEEIDFDGMRAWRLTSANGAQAVIAQRGASLLSWEPVRGKNVIAGYANAEELKNSVAHRSAICAPWVGRLGGNSYTFNGKTYELPANNADGASIHGLVFDVDFEPTHIGETLTLSYSFEGVEGYPWPFDISVNFSLRQGADNLEHLTAHLVATNKAKETIPFAFGWHPYIQIPGASVISNFSLKVPARTKILKGPDLVPLPGEAAYAGVKAPFVVDYLGSQAIDSTFRGLIPDGDGVVTSILRDPVSGIQIEFSQEPGDAPCVHVFTADNIARDSRASVAFEPLSHVPDAFNRPDSAGSIILESGASRYMTATITYRA